jgi:starvation-inducible DNA-binding protein
MTQTYTAPGLAPEAASRTCTILQSRLVSLLDTQLTLKHVHWNVVGPTFIGVHEMLDPQVDGVREMSDELAERMATLGGEPVGTPGYLVSNRSWDDYALRRDTVQAHLGALDSAYSGVISDHRAARAEVAELDPVTEDLLLGQIRSLEQYQWFVRAHLEDSAGRLQDPR